MTRADLYKAVGGGWRKAAKRHPCWRIAKCATVIQPGEMYFDTNSPDQSAASKFAKMKLCAACANEEVK